MTQQIWQNRLRREFEGLENTLGEIFGGEVKLVRKTFQIPDGTCRIIFSLSVPCEEGQVEKTITPQVVEETSSDTDKALKFTVEFDLDLHTRYPFDPPRIKVIEGSSNLPTGVVNNQVLILPDTEGWTPSNTIHSTLQSIIINVSKEHGRMDTDSAIHSDECEQFFSEGESVHIDQLRGSLFPCRKIIDRQFLGLKDESKNIYLAIKGRQILELTAHETTFNIAIIQVAYDLLDLAKLRYSRGKSVTLVLRSHDSVEDGEEVEYAMNQSYQCMQSITRALQQLGIPRHQSNSAAESVVDVAKEILVKIEERQQRLEEYPCVNSVKSIMDLYRQAAELFGSVDDDRAREVIQKMHDFLQQPGVICILDEGLLNKHETEVENVKNSDRHDGEPVLTDIQNLQQPSLAKIDKGEARAAATNETKPYETSESSLRFQAGATSDIEMTTITSSIEETDSFVHDRKLPYAGTVTN